MSDHTRQVLDGDDVLSRTFATMDMLQRAVAAELGEDDGSAYGLAPQPQLSAVPDIPDTVGERPSGV